MGLLVCYDVPSDKRRGKMAKALIRLGARVQLSVYILPAHRTIADVVAALAPLMVLGEDDIRIHALCSACEQKTILMGKARRPQLPAGFRVL